MADPVAYQILSAIAARLDAISVAGGFNTDPQLVQIGVWPIDPDTLADGPVLSVFDLGDSVQERDTLGLDSFVELRLVIEAHQVRDLADATAAMHYLIQDIKRAVFLADTRLGGLTYDIQQGDRRVNYPDQGINAISVQQEVLILYRETYGTP